MFDDKEYLTITQAAAYVSKSRRTIYNWITKGFIIPKETPSGLILIKKDDLIRDRKVKREANFNFVNIHTN